MRYLFVDHIDKQDINCDIDVPLDKIDISIIIKHLFDSIHIKIKDTNLVDILNKKYSTSNDITCIISKLLQLNTFQEYFNYGISFACGIPSIILDGSKQDWSDLNDVYEYLKRYFLIEDSELKDWVPCMDILMNMFMELRYIADMGIVHAPDKYKVLWQRVITYIRYGSGDNLLGGWVSILVPYSQNNKVKNIYQDLPCLYMTQNIKEDDLKNDEIIKNFYRCSKWNDVQNSILSISLTYNKENNLKFEGGFTKEVFINENDEVETNCGYSLFKENKLIKKKINEFTNLGFYFENKILYFPLKYYDVAYDYFSWINYNGFCNTIAYNNKEYLIDIGFYVKDNKLYYPIDMLDIIKIINNNNNNTKNNVCDKIKNTDFKYNIYELFEVDNYADGTLQEYYTSIGVTINNLKNIRLSNKILIYSKSIILKILNQITNTVIQCSSKYNIFQCSSKYNI
jgi:hypothetical protein